MSELTNDELKDKVLTLFISNGIEQNIKNVDKKNIETKQSREKYENGMTSTLSHSFAQGLIDIGFPIHEKPLNNILFQTIKEKSLSKDTPKNGSSIKTRSQSKQEIDHEVQTPAFLFEHDFQSQTKPQLTLAESKLLSCKHSVKNTQINKGAISKDNDSLNQAAKRLIQSLDFFANMSVIATAQKVREIDSSVTNNSRNTGLNLQPNFETRNNNLFRYEDILPNHYNIIDLSTIKKPNKF